MPAGSDDHAANSATLTGTASDDGLPNPPGILTTTWSKVSGPGTVTFGNANALSTTAGFSTSGTYVLRLTASDGALSSSDDMTVNVQAANQAPSSMPGLDQTITLPNSATLTGTATDDGLPNPTRNSDSHLEQGQRAGDSDLCQCQRVDDNGRLFNLRHIRPSTHRIR